MSLLPMDQKFVDEFFAVIAPFGKAYQDIGFSYLALKVGQRFVIVAARVFMNTAQPGGPPQEFSSPNVRAGHVKLTDLKLDVRGLIARLLPATIYDVHNGSN